MINLLPYELKRQTRAARTNVILFRYVVILAIAVGFVTLVCAGSYTFLTITKISNEKLLEQAKTSPTAASSIQGQVDKAKSSLATARSILDQQVVYSDVITGLGAILPKGTKIDSLSLSDSSLGTPMNMKIRAVSADLETKIKEGFSSSTLFSGYRLVSMNQEAGSPGYPYSLNISTVVNKVAAR